MLKSPLNKQQPQPASVPTTEADLKAAMDAADAEVERLKSAAWSLLFGDVDLGDQHRLAARQEELREQIDAAEREASKAHQAFYQYIEVAYADDRGPSARSEAILLEQRKARTRGWLAEVGITTDAAVAS